MYVCIESGVGILPEVLEDLMGPLGDRVRRRRLLDISISAQLSGRLRTILDISSVSKKANAGNVPESWLDRGLGAEGARTPRSLVVNMLAAHDAGTKRPRSSKHWASWSTRVGTPPTQPSW